MATTPLPLVVLIEDDAGERKALGRLLRAGGFEPAAYASAEEFLASPPMATPICLLLDIQLEGMSGLDLQDQLHAEGSAIPVIIITGSDDRRMCERAERSGCLALLRKPFEGRLLLNAIRSGVVAPRDD